VTERLESCLYVGRVLHRRERPVRHAFAKRLYLAWLDLDELPRVFRGSRLASREGRAPLCFRRSDHFGDPRLPLAEAVRREVERRSGARPAGPVRVLTHLRTFGYCFNPVSFYYCFDAAGRRVEAVLAEVENTPWSERHAYVLSRAAGAGSADELACETGKELHVSPFLAMDQRYRWRFGEPGSALRVTIENHDADGRLFAAALELERREWCDRNLAALLASQPWMTAQVTAAIYWQALRLWWKGAPFHPHPGRLPQASAPVQEGRPR
jgi:DUF1365 family protein